MVVMAAPRASAHVAKPGMRAVLMSRSAAMMPPGAATRSSALGRRAGAEPSQHRIVQPPCRIELLPELHSTIIAVYIAFSIELAAPAGLDFLWSRIAVLA